MGRRGPAPTPTALLKARGSWRGQIRDGEPTPDATIPDPPPWLRKDASRHWGVLVKLLFGIGVMADCHSIALAAVCNALARYEKLSQQTKFNARSECAAWDRVIKGLKEFGLTPSSITAVRVQKPEQKQSIIPTLRLAK